jgi:glucose/arabinose dehydrogenase
MLHPIRAALACTAVLTLAACAKTEQPAKDTAAAMAAPAPAPATPAAPAPIALADVAGKWNMVTTPVSGSDTKPTKVVMTVTTDSAGWTMTLPSGKVVKHHVTVSGDSIMLKSEPYPSMRRKGKEVVTESVLRLQDGKLVGTTTAHYAKSGADSVLVLKTEGTKQ